jgi:hypothetical protein
MNKLFVEGHQVVAGFVPVAMNSGAPSIDWVSMKNYGRCTVIFFKAIGTAGDDPTVSFKQATSVAPSNSKALAVSRVDKKQGVSLTSTGQFTTSTAASPATNDTFNTTLGTWSNSDLAEQQAVIVADIKAEDLDKANGFDCVSVTVADVGTNAQLGCLLFILTEPRYSTSPLPSAIAD